MIFVLYGFQYKNTCSHRNGNINKQYFRIVKKFQQVVLCSTTLETFSSSEETQEAYIYFAFYKHVFEFSLKI